MDLHPDHFWLDDGDVARLRFRSVYVAKVCRDGDRWAVIIDWEPVARYRSKEKAMRQLGRWAARHTIRGKPTPSCSVPGF
ncbi:MAG: hypothetical protein ACOY37_12440 [Pseudomonadota bacterium]